ncbi:MAG: hypothetical protein ACRED5_22035 [Propylenella sp.]
MRSGVLVLIVLLLSLPAATLADAEELVRCTADAASVDAPIQLAQADRALGIVARTRDSVTFRPGYTFRTVRRGQMTLMIVSDPGGVEDGAQIDCNCSNGVCFPVQEGNNKVICRSHPNQCTGFCTISFTPQPPPPGGVGG